jgi:hypothetical protein
MTPLASGPELRPSAGCHVHEVNLDPTGKFALQGRITCVAGCETFVDYNYFVLKKQRFDGWFCVSFH